jgi:hypothetical protein
MLRCVEKKGNSGLARLFNAALAFWLFVPVLVFALLSAGFTLRWHLLVLLRAGIRVMFSFFMRCPCAGRHLLFFIPQGDFLRGAAAKKSRQKKAAHTEPLDYRQQTSTAACAANSV